MAWRVSFEASVMMIIGWLSFDSKYNMLQMAAVCWRLQVTGVYVINFMILGFVLVLLSSRSEVMFW